MCRNGLQIQFSFLQDFSIFRSPRWTDARHSPCITLLCARNLYRYFYEDTLYFMFLTGHIIADMEVPTLGSWSAISTFVLGGVVLLYLYLTHTHSYWRKRGVPYVKPLPLFGNLKDVLLVRKSLGEVYRDLYW
jgi:hypothetical protein